MMTFDRHYRAPVAGRWFLRSFVAAVAAILLASLLDNQGGALATITVAVGAVVLVLIVAWGERGFPRYGLYESSEGIRAVHSLGSQTLPWNLIARFAQSKSWPRSRVVVVGKNGKIVRIVGTAQGARIVWNGGETRDIVGVLSERLIAWRSSESQAQQPDSAA